MPIADEIEPVVPGLLIWRSYDRSVKADLFSTGLEVGGRTYLIDPIDLAPDAMADLESRRPIAGIMVTNENHERAAARFADKFRVPIHLHSSLAKATSLPGAEPIRDRDVLDHELTIIAIDGGPAGEIAVHSKANGGTMVVGDALINVEPYGFAILPSKYCSNVKTLRRSLATLLNYSFERMLFAHGTPILSGARQRLEDLLVRR
ncbi:MAG: hypothetical protein QOI07_2804 [Verrucomicrobiota bacterium]|jgi:hypothetical protein